jgi:hypothetical protein
MNYIHVHDGEDGRTHLEDCEVSFASATFAPPAPALDVSSPDTVQELMFIRFPAGWGDPAHPAPARQWMFVLSGEGQSTVDGEVRAWGPGDVFFLEDISGPAMARLSSATPLWPSCAAEI